MYQLNHKKSNIKGSHFLDLKAQLLDNADLVNIKSFWLHFKADCFHSKAICFHFGAILVVF